MNIKKNQVFVELEVANWDNTDLASTLFEMCYAQKDRKSVV